MKSLWLKLSWTSGQLLSPLFNRVYNNIFGTGLIVKQFVFYKRNVFLYIFFLCKKYTGIPVFPYFRVIFRATWWQSWKCLLRVFYIKKLVCQTSKSLNDNMFYSHKYSSSHIVFVNLLSKDYDMHNYLINFYKIRSSDRLTLRICLAGIIPK